MAPRPGPSSTTHEPCDEASFASATSRSMMILSVRKCWLSSVLRRMELSPLSSLAMRFRLLLRVLRFSRRRCLREGPSPEAPSAAAAPGDAPASCLHHEAPARRVSFLSFLPHSPLPSCGHVAPAPTTRQGRGRRWNAAGRSRPVGITITVMLVTRRNVHHRCSARHADRLRPRFWHGSGSVT